MLFFYRWKKENVTVSSVGISKNVVQSASVLRTVLSAWKNCKQKHQHKCGIQTPFFIPLTGKHNLYFFFSSLLTLKHNSLKDLFNIFVITFNEQMQNLNCKCHIITCGGNTLNLFTCHFIRAILLFKTETLLHTLHPKSARNTLFFLYFSSFIIKSNQK